MQEINPQVTELLNYKPYFGTTLLVSVPALHIALAAVFKPVYGTEAAGELTGKDS
jgi:hypothetical protein